MTRHVVITLHDAGGTVPPNLAVAQALVALGHRVTVLSQPSVADRARQVGCTFVPFESLPDYDHTRALEDQLEISVPALAGPAVGDELVSLAERTKADVVVIDPNLAGSLAAAATLSCPSAVLLHSMYATFVDTWFSELWPLLADLINDTRRRFGLGAATSWAALFDEHDLLVSPVPPQLDAPTSVPAPPTLRHFGFLVPPRRPEVGSARSWYPAGDAPTVLVALSTTYQGQEALLRTILDAVSALDVRAVVTTGGAVPINDLSAGSHVALFERAPHAEILPHTDLVITHGGMGTISAALSHGVPVVCCPIERDQPLNARRVAELGAGLAVDDPTIASVSNAVTEVLASPRFHERASDLSAASGGAERAAREIIALADGA